MITSVQNVRTDLMYKNEEPYNQPECGYDGGDCLAHQVPGMPGYFTTNPDLIRDGKCSGNPLYNTASCENEGGDCQLVEGLPECFVGTTSKLGDEKCDKEEAYKTAACDWD